MLDQMSDDERTAHITAAIQDFHKNADDLPYRRAARMLIEQLVESAPMIAQSGIRDRDQILDGVIDDVHYAKYLDSMLDERAMELMNEVLGDRTFQDLDRDETFKILSVFTFVADMYQYCCARDNSLGDDSAVQSFVDSFIAQIEVYFNPVLEQYRELPDPSKLH